MNAASTYVELRSTRDFFITRCITGGCSGLSGKANVFLDISKAIDWVDHRSLLSKLSVVGLP